MTAANEFRPELNNAFFDYSREVFRDDRTNERVRYHLLNENDVITEDDIANIKTEMSKEFLSGK